jgi:hypothetical protein
VQPRLVVLLEEVFDILEQSPRVRVRLNEDARPRMPLSLSPFHDPGGFSVSSEEKRTRYVRSIPIQTVITKQCDEEVDQL